MSDLFTIDCHACGAKNTIDSETMRRVGGDYNVWPHCEQVPSCRCLHCLRAKRLIPEDFNPLDAA